MESNNSSNNDPENYLTEDEKAFIFGILMVVRAEKERFCMASDLKILDSILKKYKNW
ncbi:MAG: hypothetical protein WC877_02040 [Dehalococcoidales bacterium]|jgi:hypothetical protein